MTTQATRPSTISDLPTGSFFRLFNTPQAAVYTITRTKPWAGDKRRYTATVRLGDMLRFDFSPKMQVHLVEPTSFRTA